MDRERIVPPSARVLLDGIRCDMCDEFPDSRGDGLRLCPTCEVGEAHYRGDLGILALAIDRRRRIVDVPISPPVERRLWLTYIEGMASWPRIDLHPQYRIGRYRADFADPSLMLVIEVDGLAYHNGQESFIRDQRRQRYLQSRGWTVVRFAAKEVTDNPGRCLEEAALLIEARGC